MSLHLRAAGPDDAESIALLHADSWRRNYRGAYATEFLDGDLVADRRTVWSARLAAPEGTATIVGEDAAGLVGFVHVAFDHDDRWGSLLDNLHVRHDRRRAGIGAALLGQAADAVAGRGVDAPMFLFVLEQNTNAQRFYAAHGGIRVERRPVSPPGGRPENLAGSPFRLRIAWADARTISAGTAATRSTSARSISALES